MIQLFLKHGANIRAKNSKNISALDVCWQKNIGTLNLMVKYPDNIAFTPKNLKGQTPKSKSELKQNQDDLEEKVHSSSEQKKENFCFNLQDGNYAAVTVYLYYQNPQTFNINEEITEFFSYTPLMIACKKKSKFEEENIKIIQLLISRGAKIDAKNSKNISALDVCSEENIETLKKIENDAIKNQLKKISKNKTEFLKIDSAKNRRKTLIIIS